MILALVPVWVEQHPDDVSIQGADVQHVCEDDDWPSASHSLAAIVSQHLIGSVNTSLGRVIIQDQHRLLLRMIVIYFRLIMHATHENDDL